MQSLLRPHQVQDDVDLKASLEKKLSNPHIDKKPVVGQLKRLNHRLETQVPTEVPAKDKDAFIKETDALLEKVTEGMMSDEEMRKSPPGAIDRHRKWEKDNKENILQWKNNMLRLNVGNDDIDIANLEKYRPARSRMNMDNAFIPGNPVMLHDDVGVAQVISDEELAILKEKAPKEIYNKLPTMDREGRQLALKMYVYN